MLVRTWNLFHGNTVPPGRKAYLREMVELVTADKPDVVCLQEIPAWALGRIGDWSGMQALTARAKRAEARPAPDPGRSRPRAHGAAPRAVPLGVRRARATRS